MRNGRKLLVIDPVSTLEQPALPTDQSFVGITLADYLATSGPVSLTIFTPLAQRFTHLLASLHFHGLLHNRLNPAK